MRKMNRVIYFVEGECEAKLINALKEAPAVIRPGKIKIINVIQSVLSSSQLVQIERASELTHSRSNKDFKRDFCATTNTRYLLDRHNLVLSKLWTTHPPEEFSFVTSNSDIIKQNAE